MDFKYNKVIDWLKHHRDKIVTHPYEFIEGVEVGRKANHKMTDESRVLKIKIWNMH